MKKLLFFIAAVSVFLQLQSQNISNYSFSASSGTFTQLTGATNISLSGGTADDGYFNNIPLGFTFYYMGIPYTTLSVSTNGWITFGQAISNTWNSNSLASNGARPLVAPLWDNLNLQSGNNFSYVTSGTAPNRIFTAEWLNVQWNNGASGNTISFQVKLYEMNKKIEFVYRPESGTVNSGSASIGITATATGSGSFLSLNNSSTSPTVSSTTETANISAKPSDGQVYAFSPQYITPAVPASMTFTSVTQTGMTVNWHDNSTTETYFLVYFSQNGTNFSQVGNISSATTATTGTSYSFTQTGLLPGITYYFRITANNEGSIPSGYLSGSNSTSSPGNVFSIATGNWGDGTTWSSGLVPTSFDNVTISDGHTVIINRTAFCNALFVGQGTSGILRFGTSSTTGYSFNTIQGVTVANGGTFEAGAPEGPSQNHSLSIGGGSATAMGTGSLLVNGTFDMYIGPANGICTVNFYGIPDASVSGSGTIDFYKVILNKGNFTPTEAVIPPVLEILTPYTGSGNASTGFLNTHTAGTLKIGGSFTFSNPVYFNDSYTISYQAAFWLNNPNFTVSGLPGSPTNKGLVKLSAGTYNIGNSSAYSMNSNTGAIFLIENGEMNLAGRLYEDDAITYKQTGGTVNVSTVGNSSSSIPGFGVTNTGSVFTMSGGTICIVLANTSDTKVDYYVNASTTNITGGTLQLGNNNSGAAKTYYIRGTAPNVTLTNASANHSCNLAGDLIIKGDLALNGTGTFSNNSNSLVMAGMNTTNPGSIIVSAGAILTLNTSSSKSLTFSSSSGNQSISNSGTIAGSRLAGLTINNTYGSGGNVTIPGGLTMIGNATLNLAKGSLAVGAGGLTLGGAGSTGFTYIKGDGTISGTVTMDYGTGTVSYTYNGTSAQLTGTELPSAISGELMINNGNGVTLNSALQAGKLNLASGTLNTTATNLLTITGTATADLTYSSGQVNGPLARTLPASLAGGSTYLFPLGKGAYRPLELVNPATNSGGNVLIRAEVFDVNCGGTAGSSMFSLNTDRYWTAEITSGSGNYTNATVRLTETGLTVNSGIAKSSALAGTYELASVAGPAGNTLITDVLTNLSYFVIGTKKMNYVSSTCTQANTTFLRQASSGQEIIGLQVVTTGNIDPALVTSLTFSTNGSTIPADITAAKIFYTGTSSIFTTGTQFGSTFSNPSGSFTITGSQALAEGTNYFWLAYDISLNAGNGDAVDGECTSLTIRGSAKTPVVQAPAGNRLIKAALSGTVTVGSGGTYTTLTDAGGLFDAINQAGLRGHIIAQVISSITETGTNGLSEIYEAGGTGFTLTIRPDAAVERTVSGNPASQAMIRLNGSDRVIVDGRYGGDGKYLRFRNVSTLYPVFLINNGACHDTIRNCYIEGASVATSTGTIHFGTSTASTGNNYNSILYNSIRDRSDAAGIPYAAVCSSGTAGKENSSNNILNNEIFNYITHGVNITGSGNGSNWIISGNSFYNNLVIAPSTDQRGIYFVPGLSSVSNIISGNYIGGQASLCGGSPWVNSGSGQSFYGIYASLGTSASSEVSDNIIQNISLTNSQPGDFVGIYIMEGLANITGNVIGHSDIDHSVSSATTASNASIEGIRVFSYDWHCNVEKNIITNLVFTGNSGYPEAIGIYIYNADLRKNIITGIGHCLNETTAPYIYGIYNYGSEGYNNEISNNVIALDGATSSDPEIYGYVDNSYSINSYYFYYNSISISGPPAATANTYVFYRTVDAGYELKNNIFANFRESGGTGTNYSVYIEDYNLLNLDADYNNLYCPEGMAGYYNYSDLPTLTDWRTATGQDMNSISNDPLFEDNSNDLHPDPASSVVSAGIPLELVDTDIEDNPRDAVSPAIGAYEVTPAVKTWNGSVSGNWNDAANWTPSGVPEETDNLLIPSGTPNNCTLSTSGLICNNLTINSGAIVTVNAPAIITVNGILKIKDGALMTNYGNIIITLP